MHEVFIARDAQLVAEVIVWRLHRRCLDCIVAHGNVRDGVSWSFVIICRLLSESHNHKKRESFNHWSF